MRAGEGASSSGDGSCSPPASGAAVAAHAGVSEATAYRYFPDLVTLLRDAVQDTWPAIDDLLGAGPRGNDEGEVLATRDFTAAVIDRTVRTEPLQAAGAALLRLAWRHRQMLGG